MFCLVCKSFVSSLDNKCRVCGKVFKIKKSNKRSKNSKNKSKNKNKTDKLSSKIRKNDYLGGKTRQYNDRRNFEFSVLGCYIIW